MLSGSQKEKDGTKKGVKKIMSKNFPNWSKAKQRIQEAEKTEKDKPKEIKPRQIITKYLKTKNEKKKILNVTREQQHFNYRGKIPMIADFS